MNKFKKYDRVALVDDNQLKGTVQSIEPNNEYSIKWDSLTDEELVPENEIILAVEEEVEGNIWYTTAPKSYDGFGTRTIEITDYLDDRGKEVRKIFVPEKATNWQKQRNSSGNYATFTETEFNEYLKMTNSFKKKEMTEETKTEAKIVDSISITEKNANPLRTIEIQNPTIENNQYEPQSDACATVDTVVASSLRYDMLKAIETIDRRVNGVDEYVAEKLGYFVGNCSLDQKKEGIKCLCDAFSAEQVDALAVAIYNIEEKGQGCIIGDQTGIGKGRIAAGMIRYAVKEGLKPIFITEKPNLFTDLFRDIINIGSDDAIPIKILGEKKQVEIKDDFEDADDESENEDEENEEVLRDSYKKNNEYPNFTTEEVGKDGLLTGKIITKKGSKFLKPFILNSKAPKTIIKDEEGNILYEPNDKDIKSVLGFKKKIGVDAQGNKLYEIISGNMSIPPEYSFILATYSQFSGNELKMNFLRQQSKGNIVIMDESHNASGDSNIGSFLMTCLAETKGVTFLSATFAKRPDNMPIYASKTCISEANMNSEELVAAIMQGGVALQEIVASALTSEGQMIRRQRTFEGIEVNYEYLDERQDNKLGGNFNKSVEHKAIMDKATEIIRDIMSFQDTFVRKIVEEEDKIAAAEYGEVKEGKGVGVDMPPIFSGVFNIINQLLFSLKAESVADLAIKRMKEGKKPVIAFASTMESFFNSLKNELGEKALVGEVVSSDFSNVLQKRLDSVLKMTKTDENGKKEDVYINVDEQTQEFQFAYKFILNKITNISIGISCSPLDVIIKKIELAGFKVIEVTGRNKSLKLLDEGKAILKNRVSYSANDAFRMFNDDEVDCLMINQSGSTGASAHALPTKKISKDKVKQRVMIILQAELNINTEVQKRGRINRTGQILKPIYDYVISAVPSEGRLMIMLQKKLKSLDANTTSDQESSNELLESDTPDFLNKYGDIIATQYLLENPLLNLQIGNPLRIDEGVTDIEKVKIIEDAAHKVSGRVAILSVKDQENFYTEMSERYKSEVAYLKSTGEYDLKVMKMNFEAETISREIAVVGLGGQSVFSRNSILEKVEVNNLKKPFKKGEVVDLITSSLAGYDADSLQKSIKDKYSVFVKNAIESDRIEIQEMYENLITNITKEKAYLKLENDEKKSYFIDQRKKSIIEAKDSAIKKMEESYEARQIYINSLFNFFKVGNGIAYPTVNYLINGQVLKGVFIGFDIKDNVKNPYAPSAIKLKFALISSQRYIALPASKINIINFIMSLHYVKLTSYERKNLLDDWDELIKEKEENRVIRYIVTGNILQAFGKKDLAGTLISYTTIDGGVKKGILLPEDFSPDSKIGGGEQMRITVPIIKALPIIKSMLEGRTISTNDDFVITKSRFGNYSISVSSSKNIAGKFFLDPIIKQLVQNNIFNSVSKRMVATVDFDKMDNLVEYLQDKFKCSVNLVKQEFDRIKDSIEDVIYDDEAKKTQSDVLIEKLTEVDRFGEKEALKEADRVKFDEEYEISEKENKIENAEKILIVKNKMMNLLEILLD